MNAGDTGFMLICSALVFFMTPGLAFFYGGLVRRKNVVSTMMACAAIMGLSVVMWVLFGYSLSFGGNHAGIIGDFRWFGLHGIKMNEAGPYASTIPHLVYIAFQMMFAMITPALITGSLVGRVKFKALFLFIMFWSVIVYYPMAHMVWGQGGLLAEIGSVDFAGGNVVHISSGVSALVFSIILGRRRGYEQTGRDDEDNEIRLDKFETENTIVRRPEALEYSYDKLESVIGQHRSTLRASVATKAAHAYAPAEDTENTPVIITTGESITGRKRLRFADILALKERFDDVDVPLDERYLVLHPKHVSDLLLEDLKLFKDLTSIKDGEPLKFAGFGCYAFSRMPTYRMMDGVLKKVAFGAAAAEGDRFASFAFYAKEVMKADGDIHMYATENDPKERVTIVGFDKRFVALPIRGKGIGAIVSASV